jgi:TonB family protein
VAEDTQQAMYKAILIELFACAGLLGAQSAPSTHQLPTPLSPGKAIDTAAQAAAARRGEILIDSSQTRLKHAVLVQKSADSNPLQYPRKALDAKVEGLVRLEAMVGTNGEIEDLKTIEGDDGLAAAATTAIAKWRFHPAKKDGKKIEDAIRMNVVFRLDSEQARVQVVYPEPARSPDQKLRNMSDYGAFDILSDTHGVDFGPYLQAMLPVVRANWYHLIPESAEFKKGKLAIEFVITKDGKVADMRLIASSGDVALDRPAWASITASNPFPPLPGDFTGPYLALRVRFYYNPDKTDLQ